MKRLFFLALICIGLFSGMAGAVTIKIFGNDQSLVKVSVGGAEQTGTGADPITYNTTGAVTLSTNGASVDAYVEIVPAGEANFSLTLNACVLNTGNGSAIKIEDVAKSTVTLTGTNQLSAGNYGLNVISTSGQFPALEVQGGGSLKITTTNQSAGAGIRADGEITISGGVVDINSTSNGIHAISGSVTISSGRVSVDADGTGIFAYDDITISGGVIDINSSFVGMQASPGSVAISNGQVTIDSSLTGIAAKDDITISGGTVSVTAIGAALYSESGIIDINTQTDVQVSDKDGKRILGRRPSVPLPEPEPLPEPAPAPRTEDVEGLPFPRELSLNGGLIGGKPLALTSLKPGDKLPVPVKDGYLFAGWYTNPGFTGDPVTTVPLGETVFYARWEKLGGAYIVYDENAGDDKVSGKPSKCMANPDGSTTYTLSKRIPKRDGYKFLGWSLSADGSGKLYQPGEEITLSEPTLLHAAWKKA